MEKNMLVYAMSSRERLEILSSHYNDYKEDNVSKWLSRRSLCTEELFELSLKEQKISREKFNLAIKTLDENDIMALNKANKKKNWYQKAMEIFGDEYLYLKEPEIIDFAYAFRPFLNYMKNEMEKVELADFTISENAGFLIHLAEEFVQIASKTLVYDLHEQKKKYEFEGKTSKERFVYYMKKRFGSKASIINFYEEYPVLLRLLTERVLFHVDNYKQFIKAIQQSLPELRDKFSIMEPYQVTEISVGAGDSHGRGKTVVLFNLNGQEFVFKYKDLEIGERFNKFLDYLEKRIGKKFYKIKRITNEKYCIEEFISNRECKTEDEIIKYYHRFGEYVALAYLLCGNDFHYENVIAHGEFPVLIDIETLIQNDSPIKRADNPYVKLSEKKYSSVLSTALLPFKAYENRIEPLAEGEVKGKGINISAFDGSKQKSPYKGLSLINENTDQVKFQYTEFELNGSNNIPILNGVEVNAEQYKSEVVKGFEDICQYFCKNTDEIISVIEDIFSNVVVRNVIKTTQKYVDMIWYGYHPKCMRDYLEREKLFENLWAFEYKNKSAILPEIKDLLLDDVPIFFNNTSSCDLITSDKLIIPNYYQKTAIERVKERILKFDEKEYKYQKLRLELSLGIYKMQKEPLKLGATIDEAVKNIVDIIYRRASFDKARKFIAFEDFLYELDGTLDYDALKIELYDGLSGVYLFILYYAQNNTSPQVEILKYALEKSIFKMPKKKEKNYIISAYDGKYSVLYPLYHKYKLEKKEEDLELAENLLADIAEEVNQNTRADWVNGVSALIQVLLGYYELTKRKHFLDKAEMLSEIWDKEKIVLCGFAHGFSGVIYAAYSLYRATGNEKYFDRVERYLELENKCFDGEVWKDLRKGKKSVSYWCHGTIGIGLTRLYLLKNGFDNDQVRADLLNCVDNVINMEFEEPGICHGNMGRFLFLKEVQNSEMISVATRKKINVLLSSMVKNILDNGIKINSFDKKCVLGLMTGITGIGYGLLGEIESSIPNILSLDR